MERRAAAATVVSLGLLLFLACQPDSSVQPGKNRAPTATIGGPDQGIEGTGITLDATGTHDPDGDTLTYAWYFGDGGKGTGRLPEHAYRDEGSYEVTLIATDSRGASDTASTTILIANAPPVIVLTIPMTPLALGTPATIQVAFSDPGVLDSLTAAVDWGDSTTSPIANGSSTHTYTAAGGYMVIVTVRDNDGAVSTKVAPGSIAIVPPSHPDHRPVAMISGSSTGREGGLVMFSARGSTDPDGDALQYTWSPGDGRSSWAPSTIIEQGWSYDDNGVYTVSVIVSDSSGAADTASTTVTVVNAPPVVSLVSPPAQQAVGVPATTRIVFSDSGSNDTHTITIRWGDGTSDSVAAVSTAWGNDSISHTYVNAGSYSVSATVRDDDGGVADSRSAGVPVIVFDAAERQTVAGYEVLDLGTLGGNSALPADFNNRGQVVGSSLTAGGATHAFFWDGGVMQDLGTLGYVNSEGKRINDAGLIAGAVWTGWGDDSRHSIAAIWRNGNGTILDAPAGPLFVDAMNESGDVLWRQPGHESGRNWLWRNGAWLSMDNWFSLKQPSNAAMNDHGQIVIREGFHARLWEADSLHDLGVLSWRCAGDPLCGWSFPMDINESGQIVGTSSDTGKITRFVLWENGAIRALALAPEASGWATHAYINDRGQIAVSAAGEAFFWSDGNRQSVVAPGGLLEVAGLNENGEAAGTFLTGTGEQHVFVWSQSRGMVDLGAGPHGFTAAWAVGINSRGDIIGYTAPCELDYYHKCGYPQQVRAILWRKTTP